MSDSVPTCISCGEREKIAKLSSIYFDALSMIAHPADPLPQSLALLQRQAGQGSGGVGRARWYHEIVRMAAPPRGEKRVIRRLHPDAVVFSFAAISAFVLFQMLKGQPQGLLPAEGILVLALGAYLAGRRFILRRYHQERDKERKAGQRVQGAIEQWMKLYYCANEGISFDPGARRTYATASLSEELMEEQGSLDRQQ